LPRIADRRSPDEALCGAGTNRVKKGDTTDIPEEQAEAKHLRARQRHF
jgi:hypothetical protein